VDAGGEVMPSVVGGVVVVKSGVLPNPAPVAGYALEDGRRLWTASFGFDYGTSALTSAGLLFDEGPSGGSQRLLLLDPASGKARWEVPAQVFVDAPVVAGDFLVEGEGVPGPDGGGGSKLVIRRVADGGVKETVPGVSYSDHGVAAGRRAYLPVSVTDGQGFTHALVLVEDGVVRNRHPLERMAHRPPAVLDDGGVAIQIADAMCATTLAGG
jgi:outer membrane protein assembly factor BamB